MVCERTEQKTSVKDLRNQIKKALNSQRQQTVARRKIRDLHRAAIVEIRLPDAKL
jgi:hypothetical protein